MEAFAHIDGLLVSRLIVAKLQVVHYGRVEQLTILRHDHDVLAEASKLHLRHVLVVDEHATLLWIVQAVQQVK